jgi:hypothetical protein
MSVLMALILEAAVMNELLRNDIPCSKYVIVAVTFHLQIFKIVFQEIIVNVFKVVSLDVRRLDLQVFKQTNARAHTGA